MISILLFGIQNTKGEPTCDLFELFDTSSHLLEFCICVDKITSTWMDHDEHWNSNLSLMLMWELKSGVVPPNSGLAQTSMRSASELLTIKADSELERVISRRAMAVERWATGDEPVSRRSAIEQRLDESSLDSLRRVVEWR
jgi:hypothetical protein